MFYKNNMTPKETALKILSDMYTCNAYLSENKSKIPNIELAKKCALVVIEHNGIGVINRSYEIDNIVNSEENVLVMSFAETVDQKSAIKHFAYWDKVKGELNLIT